MPKPLHGVLPIVHTPFDARDEIDPDDLRREIDWAFSVGADGLGTGMVSELLRLTPDERLRLTELIVEFVAGRGAVFAGVGSQQERVGAARGPQRDLRTPWRRSSIRIGRRRARADLGCGRLKRDCRS